MVVVLVEIGVHDHFDGKIVPLRDFFGVLVQSIDPVLNIVNFEAGLHQRQFLSEFLQPLLDSDIQISEFILVVLRQVRVEGFFKQGNAVYFLPLAQLNQSICDD